MKTHFFDQILEIGLKKKNQKILIKKKVFLVEKFLAEKIDFFRQKFEIRTQSQSLSSKMLLLSYFITWVLRSIKS